MLLREKEREREIGEGEGCVPSWWLDELEPEPVAMAMGGGVNMSERVVAAAVVLPVAGR